jgi:iron-sulfur cluster assembly protein
MNNNLPKINNDLVAPVHISARAQTEIRDTLSANKIPETYGLRVGLRGGMCSATFLLGFDTASETDREYLVEGIKVIIDRRHLMYVLGVTIDYEESGEGQGFTVVSSEHPKDGQSGG